MRVQPNEFDHMCSSTTIPLVKTRDEVTFTDKFNIDSQLSTATMRLSTGDFATCNLRKLPESRTKRQPNAEFESATPSSEPTVVVKCDNRYTNRAIHKTHRNAVYIRIVLHVRRPTVTFRTSVFLSSG